jgi:hypothetical protein
MLLDYMLLGSLRADAYGFGPPLPPGFDLPSGTRMYTSAVLQAILATAKGRLFYAETKKAIQAGWSIRAVGSQTASELVDRITGVFTEFAAARWTAPISAYALSGSADLARTVDLICPLCTRKGAPTPLPIPRTQPTTGVTFTTVLPWHVKYKNELLIGAGVIAAAALLGMLSRRRSSSGSAKVMLVTPSVIPALPAPAK